MTLRPSRLLPGRQHLSHRAPRCGQVGPWFRRRGIRPPEPRQPALALTCRLAGAGARTLLPPGSPVPAAIMLRVLGGFSARGDSVLVIGGDAGWWLACGAGMARALTGVTVTAGTAMCRQPGETRQAESAGLRDGMVSLAVVTAARPRQSGTGRHAAQRVPAASIRKAARPATGILRPGGHLIVVLTAFGPGGGRRGGGPIRAPRIPGVVPYRHLVMTRDAAHLANRASPRGPGQAGGSPAGPDHPWAGQRPCQVWHLLVYVKPGQVIPFPRRRYR